MTVSLNCIVYSINYSPELTGIGKYNGELITALCSRKFCCTVVTAPPYYPEWQIHPEFKNSFNERVVAGVKEVRCPLYVPAKPSTFKRLLHLASFALTSAVALFKQWRYKPDFLFIVQPTLFCVPFALFFAKLRGINTVLHIQDYELDAMFGLGMSKPGLLKRLACKIETFLYRRFDMVSSISYSMLKRAESKGVDPAKLLFFPNWSDTDFVNPTIDASHLRQAWGFAPEDKIILYSGNMGQKQGLEIIVEAAKQFSSDPNIKFLLIGSGAYRATLEQLVANAGLSNVQFKDLQPWELVPQILVMADLHLVVQKLGVADAVLPSKLTNILSAGGYALVTAEDHTELAEIAQKHPGIYHLVPPEQPAAFIAGIKHCLQTNIAPYNAIARDYAVANLNRDQIIDRFVADMQALVNKGTLR